MEDITYLSDSDTEKLDKLFSFLKTEFTENKKFGIFSLDAILEQKLNEENVISQRGIIEILANSGLTNVGNFNGERHIWSQSCNLKGAAFDSFKNEKERQKKQMAINRGMTNDEKKILVFLFEHEDVNNVDEVVAKSKLVSLPLQDTKIALYSLLEKGYIGKQYTEGQIQNNLTAWIISNEGKLKAIKISNEFKPKEHPIKNVYTTTLNFNGNNYGAVNQSSLGNIKSEIKHSPAQPKTSIKKLFIGAIISIICTLIAGGVLYKLGWI
ncbi:MAG: hypothetical protein V4511_07800 [Bacteroidota bacterium]